MQAEAVNYTAYALNRTETSAEKGTPIELWHKKRSDILNLKTFGEKIYFHIPKEKRRKWDVKAKKGIFVGYNENIKGFRIWIPKRGQVKICRDVRFVDQHYEFNSNEEYQLNTIIFDHQNELDSNEECELNTTIFDQQKDDTTKINESVSVIQSENNEQVNLDERVNLDEQNRRLRDRNKI